MNIPSKYPRVALLHGGAALLSLCIGAARADVITDWNVTALGVTEPSPRMVKLRALAITDAATLAKVPDGAGKDGGLAVGREVAQKYIAARSSDGSERKPDYTPGSGPGPPALDSAEYARDLDEVRRSCSG